MTKSATIQTIYAKKSKREPIAMLTCYDATWAKIVDDSGVDVVLVGDSLGMVVKGESNTLNVSVEEMVYHTKAVKRGISRAHIVADMPFLSFHGSHDDAVMNAGQLLQAGANAVKLEGGSDIVPVISRLLSSGIPVMGHVGLMPQHVNAQGGFVRQGQTDTDRDRIFNDATAIDQAGVYAMVLEGIPADLADRITQSTGAPTIGIGAGPHCDGQVLVLYDVLGLDKAFRPSFVRRYLEGAQVCTDACKKYVDDVKNATLL